MIKAPKAFQLHATYVDATAEFLPTSVREACLGGYQKPLNPHAQRLLVASHKAAGRLEMPKGKAKAKAKAKGAPKSKAKAKAKSAAHAEKPDKKAKSAADAEKPDKKAKSAADAEKPDKKTREKTPYGLAKTKYMTWPLISLVHTALPHAC